MVSKYIVILILIALLGGVLACMEWGLVEFEIRVPYSEKVPGAESVGSLENKFAEFRYMSFGGAGAGGMGAPSMHANSSSQFISISDGGRIFKAFENAPYSSTSRSQYSCGFRYWAFVDGVGIVEYTDYYSANGRVNSSAKCMYFSGSSIVFEIDDHFWFDAHNVERKARAAGWEIERK